MALSTTFNKANIKVKNDYYTPRYAVEPILKYLDKSKIYWECCDIVGGGQIYKTLKENGFNVISTTKEQVDFLKDTPSFDFDIIITNPPYSKKNDILKRCYEYNKPFILLLPITTLETEKRNDLFRKYGLDIVVLDKRVMFYDEKMQMTKGTMFNTSWFSHGIVKKEQAQGSLIYEKLIR